VQDKDALSASPAFDDLTRRVITPTSLPPHCFAPAMRPAMIPVAPRPTGHDTPPQMGQTLFSASAPAKMDHHPAKRSVPDAMSLLVKEEPPPTAVSPATAGAAG
jgi:hypothetical protein